MTRTRGPRIRNPSKSTGSFSKAGKSASFPFNLHPAAEARGATVKVGSNVLHDHGRLAVADDPRVKAVAARYAGRPGLE